jgi:hypothetical protein
LPLVSDGFLLGIFFDPVSGLDGTPTQKIALFANVYGVL